MVDFLSSFTRLGLGAYTETTCSGTIVRIVGLVPLCLIRRSVVRLLDLAELHRSGSVDADAALDASSRTPVLGVVVRRRGGDTVGATENLHR